MTIKPGTLCMVVGQRPCRCVYRKSIVTVLGGPSITESHCNFCKTFFGMASCYDIDGGDGTVVMANRLRPLNDPDSAPADPAYTKRRVHA